MRIGLIALASAALLACGTGARSISSSGPGSAGFAGSSSAGQGGMGGGSSAVGGSSAIAGATSVSGSGGTAEETGGPDPAGAPSVEPACRTDGDCDAFNQNLCLGRLVCVGGSCVRETASAVSCTSLTSAACEIVACNPSNGQCEPQNAADGSACDDGAYCTLADQCSAGKCIGSGSPCAAACLSCNEQQASCDINPGTCYIAGNCLTPGARRSADSCDACDPAKPAAWSTAADGLTCNDGQVCTSEDTCSAGRCGGAPLAPPAPQTRVECENTLDGRLPGRARPHPRRPVVSWNFVNDACGAVTFEIMFDDSCDSLASCTFPSPELDVDSISGSSWSPPADLPLHAGLPVATRYAWRIRARRSGSSSPWSAPRWVTVGRARNDLNGDGYSDVVWTRWKDYIYSMYYYPGSPGGPSTAPAAIMPTPYIGDANSSTPFARRIRIGDLNADGFDDIVAEGDDHPGITGRLSEGRFYVYYGSATGPSATPSLIAYNRTKTLEGFPFGLTVSDVNADGFADVVTPTGQPGATGVMYFYPGSVQGISALPVPTSFPELGGDGAALNLGVRGDVNGDCYEDMMMDERAASFALGSSAGPGSPSILLHSDDRLTQGIASGGDVNGDGRSDVVVRSIPPGHRDAQLMIFYGPFGAYYSDIYACDLDGDGQLEQAFNGPGRCPNQRIAYPKGDQLFGSLIAIDGDVNGDGISDLVLRDDTTGTLHVHHGTLAGLAQTSSFSTLDFYTYPSNFAYVGDTNADGFDDLLIDHGYNENGVLNTGLWVYLGGANGLSEAAQVALDPLR